MTTQQNEKVSIKGPSKNGGPVGEPVGGTIEEVGEFDLKALKALGFAEVSFDAVGFYMEEVAPGVANNLKGILLSREMLEIDGEPRVAYAVRLTAPTMCVTGAGDQRQTLQAQVGDHVLVNEKAKTKVFGNFLPRQLADGRTVAAEVVFLPGKKLKLKRGRTMWTGKPLIRPLDGGEIKKHGLAQMAQLAGAQRANLLSAENPIDVDDDGNLS